MRESGKEGEKSCHVDLVWLPGIGGGRALRGGRSCFEKTGAPCEGNERTQAHSEVGRDTERKKNRGREKRVVCVQVPEREKR